ncbi:MFS general substrate transporter [Sarocladium strictum]
MGLGVLNPKDGHHVPGTVNLDDQAASYAVGEAGGGRNLKHAKGKNSHIVLVPQPSDDPNDPLNWSDLKRNLVLAVIFLGTGMVGVVPGPILNAGIVQIAMDLKVTFTDIAKLSGYLTLALGAVSPIVSAVSRKYGKRPIFVFSSILGVIGCLVAEFAPGYPQLLAGRVLQGIGSSAYESLCLSVIADLCFVHERGFYVAVVIFCLGALSNGVGIIAGVITTNLGWQYNFHILLPFLVVQMILVIFFCPETTYNRPAVYNIDRVGSETDLSHKDQAQLDHVEKADVPAGGHDTESSGQTSVPGKKTFFQEMALYNGKFTDKSIFTMAITSVAVMFNIVTSYNVFISGLIMAWFVGMAVLSGVFLAGPPWMFTSSSIGYVFTGPFIGGLLASVLMGWVGDPFIKFMSRRNNGVYEPEFRLLLALPGAICTVVGLVAFGSVIDAGKSVYLLSFLWGFTLFGMAIVGSVTSAYALDAMPSLSVETFIFNVTFKNFFFYGITNFIIPWYMTSGPLKLFGTLSGLSAFLMSLTIPMYIFGKRYRRYWGHHNILVKLGLDEDPHVK